MASQKNDFVVSLTPSDGEIYKFYAFLNGKRIIVADGDKKRQWSGAAPTTSVTLKVRVTGLGKSKYTLGIDLPGNARDQSLELTLNRGYHEIEITL